MRTGSVSSCLQVSTLRYISLPLGFQSKELIIKAGLTLGDVDQYPQLDVTIDGADECVTELR
jgi:ribose 5-phosphate isomerase A